jgi:antitoxin MazE
MGDIMNSKKHFGGKINKYKGGDFMSTVVAQKWGNSLGVRIPKDVAEKIGIKQGSEMELIVVENEGSIILKPKRTRKKYTLEELIEKITPDNRHEEMDFGIEGRELF